MPSSAIGSRGQKVVALGGGHGLYASLSALKILTRNITAIVTVADDGGSSGRLREELGVLPPGDLRMALSALCDDGEWGQTWRDVLQHRFSSQGPLNGHSLGNLLITGLWELLDDSMAGLDWVGRLLDVKGRVVPMAAVPIDIEADVRTKNGLETIHGQVSIARSHADIEAIRISPTNPPAVSEALEAISAADWVIFGPGSWYTSVIPHLMVPEIHRALIESPARKALVINLVADAETVTMTPADHVRSFHDHAPDLRLDAVIMDASAKCDWNELDSAAALCGAKVFAHHVADVKHRGCHDHLNLAAAYRQLFVDFAVSD
ncbi:gluconeogenesis factor YvcK family protein [Arcanobacterium bovis]|uniref:Putative gluconeogenesis factor n=1 Tax=Arcanobacterium bovis TaxID=2529275 RepID=A0A4V2KR84_9ACTO|nr:uridine diphosphate-N-acetylglucosamine-binding protein YvcK [Arcanobacterium bovis]TBW22949.1 uridine diphosphate-N-acetylglucosamine-binding protein YvcK [Arcanobacterium bovis]